MASIIDRAAEMVWPGTGLVDEEGRNLPPRTKRRIRDWGRLIGLCRKLEAQEADAEQKRRDSLEALAKENRQLIHQVAELQYELRGYRLAERMRDMRLSEGDQKLLLSAVKNGGNEQQKAQAEAA